jgi:restriction endonuclease S subunit
MTIQLSFPTQKLGDFIVRVTTRVKDTSYDHKSLTVYGVTNKEGITITGKKASEDLNNYILLKENQFAYNPYRVNVGSIGLTPQGAFGVVSPAYVVFETTPELNSEFLLFYLKSPLGLNLIKWYGDRGGVRSALRYNELSEIDIPLLTIEQQKTAMKIFFTVKERLDMLHYELNYQQEHLAMLRQAILQEAIQGKLVEQNPDDEPASVLLEKIREEKERLVREKIIKKEKPLPPITENEVPFELPMGWEWVRLGSIVSFLGGFAFKSGSYVENSHYQIVRLGNVKNNVLLLSVKPAFIPEDIAKESTQYKIKEDDLLVTMTGTQGKRDYFYTCLISNEHLGLRNCYLNQRVGCLRGFPSVNMQLINVFLKSSSVLDAIFSTETGTANQGNIGSNAISNLVVPLPPEAEQRRIVEKVDQLMEFCDAWEDNVEQSKLYSEMLMSAVLQEAFNQ